MKPTCPHCGKKNVNEKAAACPACGESFGAVKPARRAREYDGYAVGKRLLRLAPAWLLLIVVASVLFFSWVGRRDGSEDEAFRNEATNQPAQTPEAARTAAPPSRPAPAASATPAAKAEAKGESDSYSVQVGAFAEPSQANEQVSRLRAAGFEARVVEAHGATRFRFQVRSGLYATREEAARLVTDLRARGVAGETVIVEPEKR
jgi:septal ring-binding cell division protein DamX